MTDPYMNALNRLSDAAHEKAQRFREKLAALADSRIHDEIRACKHCEREFSCHHASARERCPRCVQRHTRFLLRVGEFGHRSNGEPNGERYVPLKPGE
jgi:rubrerythrin